MSSLVDKESNRVSELQKRFDLSQQIKSTDVLQIPMSISSHLSVSIASNDGLKFLVPQHLATLKTWMVRTVAWQNPRTTNLTLALAQH